MELRDAIQEIAVKWPAYGYRRITAALRPQYQVNHKRVLSLMHKDNLLCVRRRPFVLTTDSNHKLGVYPNLAKGLELSRLNQLWVSDITYIRLAHEFVYLAVILDAFSRRVIGWNLGRSLETRLVVGALKKAFRSGRVEAGLIHHSDRGVQYASAEYVAMLLERNIRISMSRRGNCYDNAKAETFFKTLKQEQVYRSEYRDFADARSQIGRFIDQVYNRERLHSAIGYHSPMSFESSVRSLAVVTAGSA